MANSYSESNYPHKLVAFLDVLGFKDLVMQDREGALQIIDKYRWIAEYHNYKFNEIFDADEWEKDYATTVINETTIHMSSVFPYFKKEKFGVRSITPKELMEEL